MVVGIVRGSVKLVVVVVAVGSIVVDTVKDS